MYGLIALLGLISIGHLSLRAVRNLKPLEDEVGYKDEFSLLELLLYVNVGVIFVYLLVFVFYEMKALIVAGLLAILIYALFKFKSIVNSAESDTYSPAFKYLDGLEGGFNVILSNTLFIAFTYIFYLGLSYGIT